MTRSTTSRCWVATAVLAAGFLCVSSGLNARAAGPRLLVVLVADQMRADYIERFQHQWTAGLRRLVDDGAWFRLAEYSYYNTVTCAGHASVATGSLPATHGIILNQWWDREWGRRVSCTEDPTARGIGYATDADEGHSAWRLMIPTLADELRAQMPVPPRVATMSLKARAAIMLAGHGGDAVTWFGDGTGWMTSSAFGPGGVEAVERFVEAHPLAHELERTWEKMLPPGDYLYPDVTTGKRPQNGWTTSWPHAIRSHADQSYAEMLEAWRGSPFSDAYLGRLAMHLVDTEKLGTRETTDFLGVSFSALDIVGHDFGPESHEVQDVLVALDRTIGDLLTHLDRRVGRDRYVVALTADHGVAPVVERRLPLGLDAGRVDTGEIARRVEAALSDSFGPGTYVARVEYTDLYFTPGTYARLREDTTAMAAAIEAIRSVPGVARVYRSDDLATRSVSEDPQYVAAARSYFATRSGDLIVLPKPYWFTTNDATTHGTTHRYNTRVPVILMGAGIKAGQYLTSSFPTDIAPTLAFLAGVTLAQPDGRVLVEALAP